MSTLIYRNAAPDDLKKIVAIYNSTVASRMVTADTEEVSIESRLQWFNEHAPAKRPLWIVADDNKNTIGWVSFQSFYGRPAYDATAEISIYLDPLQKGKGYGRQVLQYCVDNAPTFGVKNLLDYIFSHNTPSINLFLKLGFTAWGNFKNIALLDGVERSVTIVGKRL